jgi:hypothetical protein
MKEKKFTWKGFTPMTACIQVQYATTLLMLGIDLYYLKKMRKTYDLYSWKLKLSKITYIIFY